MGKAKILSGGENGLYTIELDYGDEERDKVVEKLAGRLKELAPQLDEAKAKLDEAKGKENASKDATKEATDDYVAATEVVPVAFKAVTTATNALPGKAAALQQAIGWLKSVTAMEPPASPEQLALAEAAVAAADAAHKSAQGALKTAEAEYAAAQADVKAKMDAQVAAAKELVAAKKETAPLEIAHELLKDERAQLIKDRSYYAGLQLTETRKAWCADLTEDAKDEVATIEIPGDSSLVLINAGAEDGGTVDGVLFAREMQSPEQVFWNAAVLPGWQKWKPTYRRGTITALDLEANTADVALEEETSTGQKLNINQTKTLEKVPVIYMGCHAGAFEVGDACVVRFDGMDWEKPQVVGFVDNPKSCPGGIGIVLCGLDGQLLPGHIGSDGEGVMYLLAPKAVKGTRTATGEWIARKMPKWSAGGKAVNAGSTGRIYFAGIQGRGDSNYPSSFVGEYGSVNERAYAVENSLALPVYRHGKNVGSSRDDRAPLPFVLEWTDGEKYAAQLVPRFHVGKSTTAMVELLVGPIKTDPDKQVGAIVATVDMPPDTIMPFWKISVHPSGRKARALSFSGGNVCKIDFEITPTSLTYATSGCRSNMVDEKDDKPAAIIDGGIEFGVGTRHQWQNIINPVRTIETTLDSSFVYAYGPKGEEFDFQIDGGKRTTVSSIYYDWVEDGVDTAPYETTFTSTLELSSSSITTSNGSGSEISEFFGHGGSYTSAERSSQSKTSKKEIVANANLIYSVSSGGGEYTETTRSPSGIVSTFFDRNVGFAIGEKYAGEVRTVTGPINSDNQIIAGTGTTTVTPVTIEVIAKHRKTGEFLILPKKTGGHGQLVAFSAADPLTGSVVVNLQKRSTGPDAAVLESWIFLVDEHGVKTVQDVVPGLPQNVCAQENRLLITV